MTGEQIKRIVLEAQEEGYEEEELWEFLERIYSIESAQMEGIDECGWKDTVLGVKDCGQVSWYHDTKEDVLHYLLGEDYGLYSSNNVLGTTYNSKSYM